MAVFNSLPAKSLKVEVFSRELIRTSSSTSLSGLGASLSVFPQEGQMDWMRRVGGRGSGGGGQDQESLLCLASDA